MSTNYTLDVVTSWNDNRFKLFEDLITKYGKDVVEICKSSKTWCGYGFTADLKSELAWLIRESATRKSVNRDKLLDSYSSILVFEVRLEELISEINRIKNCQNFKCQCMERK